MGRDRKTRNMILGIFGPPRAGKSTAARILHKECNFRSLAVGDEIRGVAHYITREKYTDEIEDVPRASLDGKTPRDLYEYLGRMDEHFGPGLWVNRMLDTQVTGFDGVSYVIESVAHQEQWHCILRWCMKRGVYCRLMEVSRPDYVYRDNRRPVTDRLQVITVHNSRDLGYLKSALIDAAMTMWNQGETEGRNWSMDLRWLQDMESE